VAKRTYGQFCGLARALELVGERWTLLIVRDLSLGPQRYGDLAGHLPGMASGLLATRLKHLEAIGVVRRAVLPPPANVGVYELTDEGRALAEATMPLTRWGAAHLEPERGDLLFRADWLLSTFRAAFDPEAAVGVSETYEFHVDGEVVHVRVDDGGLDVVRGPSPVRPALVVRTTPDDLVAVGTGRMTPDDAVAGPGTEIEGDADALARCARILGGFARDRAAAG
jgi:DNA-binding HxlR family transcriptional regulator